MKKYILLFLLGILFINPVCAKEKFYIEKYDSNIIVDSKNNYNVKEKMDVFFTLPANGIYRKFPTREEIIKTDGKKYSRISEISLKEKNITDYSGYNANSERVRIRLGNPDKKIKGKKTYLFDYLLSFDKKTNIQNELYFDIVSTQWNVDVKKTHFKITFPKKIKTETIKFSIGQQSKIKPEERVKYTTDGLVIEGDVVGIIKPNEGLVLRVGVSDEYYNHTPLNEQGFVMLLIVMFAICIFGSSFIYIGRKLQ